MKLYVIKNNVHNSVKIMASGKGDTLDLVRKENTLNVLISKLRIQIEQFEASHTPFSYESNTEIKHLLNENDRLKLETENELKDLQKQFELNLQLAKQQYERDLHFVADLHREKIFHLENLHNDEINDAVKQYQEEIDYLQNQLQELSGPQSGDQLKKLTDTYKFEKKQALIQINNLKHALTCCQDDKKKLKDEILKLRKDLERKSINTNLEKDHLETKKFYEEQHSKDIIEIKKLQNQLKEITEKAQIDKNKLNLELQEQKQYSEELEKIIQDISIANEEITFLKTSNYLENISTVKKEKIFKNKNKNFEQKLMFSDLEVINEETETESSLIQIN